MNPAVYFWLVFIFAVGAVVGSLLNVCIYRLPLEKSILWPLTSRCGHCLQPIRWYDNLPIVSYWVLRGRCRVCGGRFSVRYSVVELLTALCFLGLFYLEVIANLHNVQIPGVGRDQLALRLVTIFAFHAVLLSFLLVATFADFDHHAIPLSLTVGGTVIGLVGSATFPWPWPYPPGQGVIRPGGGWFVPPALREGLYPWPVFWPLPAWLQPDGSWYSGLATGVAGMLAGTLALRAVRFLFGFGMGADYMEPLDPDAEPPRGLLRRSLTWAQRVGGKAMGLGDADLMMMAGAFIGWQPVLVAFFVAVFPGLLFAVAQYAVRGNQPIPFGPALATGVMITVLGWHRIGPHFAPLFFNAELLGLLVGVACALMLLCGYLLRIFRLTRS